jgi:photosystem II stability/assembly factor-like uncharacterized protein
MPSILNTWSLTYNGTSSSTDYLWSSITSNSTGQYLAATSPSNGIYVSSDYGTTWKNTFNSFTGLTYIKSNSSGKYLAVCGGDRVYTSNDYGNTWILQKFPSNGNSLTAITSNSSGQYLAVCGEFYGIYVSSNYGIDWIQSNAPSTYEYLWTAITTNANGNYMFATYTNVNLNGSGIYVSSNYGINWSLKYKILGNWTQIISDATGQYVMASSYSSLVVTNSSGGIYKSNDYGITWNKTTANVNYFWTSISSDSTGQKLVTTTNGGNGIYVSNDGGTTWIQPNNTFALNYCWAFIVASSDGNYLAAINENVGVNSLNGIYTYKYIDIPTAATATTTTTATTAATTAATTTNYLTIGGIDLGLIFQPLNGGTPAAATGYKIKSGADLNTLFAPYSSGTKAQTTNYNVNGKGDLNNIFAPVSVIPFTTTKLYYNLNSTPIYTYNDGAYDSFNSNGYTVVIIKGLLNVMTELNRLIATQQAGSLPSPQPGTITFHSIIPSVNYIVVGGGSNGDSSTAGKGGQVIVGTFNKINSSPITVTINSINTGSVLSNDYTFLISTDNTNTVINQTGGSQIVATNGKGNSVNGVNIFSNLSTTPPLINIKYNEFQSSTFSWSFTSLGGDGEPLNKYPYQGNNVAGGGFSSFISNPRNPSFISPSSPAYPNTGGGGGADNSGSYSTGAGGCVIFYFKSVS